MKKILITAFTLLIGFSSFSQVKDIDGNEYKTVKIGEQEWMAENLNVTHFRNGDEIPQAKTAKEWANASVNKLPVWCFYKFDEENDTIYGKLYNFYVINDPRGLAPDNWEVPALSDWKNLAIEFGGEDKAGYKLKSKNNWAKNGVGNNESEFNILPGGFIGSNGRCGFEGKRAIFWSTDEVELDLGKAKGIAFSFKHTYMELVEGPNGYGGSVRCLKK